MQAGLTHIPEDAIRRGRTPVLRAASSPVFATQELEEGAGLLSEPARSVPHTPVKDACTVAESPSKYLNFSSAFDTFAAQHVDINDWTTAASQADTDVVRTESGAVTDAVTSSPPRSRPEEIANLPAAAFPSASFFSGLSSAPRPPAQMSPPPRKNPAARMFHGLLSPGFQQLSDLANGLSPIVAMSSPGIRELMSPSLNLDTPVPTEERRSTASQSETKQGNTSVGSVSLSQVGAIAAMPFPSPSSYHQSSQTPTDSSNTMPGSASHQMSTGHLDLDEKKEVQRRIDFTVVKKVRQISGIRPEPVLKPTVAIVKTQIAPEPPTPAPAPAGAGAPRKSNGNSNNKQRQCNCKKSRCLKLYCECFAAGILCSECNCANCQNISTHLEERNKAIEETLARNPTAFRAKIDDSSGGKHNKGCACKKSNCRKKYCECFQAKIQCSEMCKCKDCFNDGQNRPPDERASKKPRFSKNAAPKKTALDSLIMMTTADSSYESSVDTPTANTLAGEDSLRCQEYMSSGPLYHKA